MLLVAAWFDHDRNIIVIGMHEGSMGEIYDKDEDGDKPYAPFARREWAVCKHVAMATWAATCGEVYAKAR